MNPGQEVSLEQQWYPDACEMQSSERDFYQQEMEFPNLIAWKYPVYPKTKFYKKYLLSNLT